MKITIKNVIENLERYYQSFIRQQGDWEFFLGLADYIEYAVKNPEAKKILNSIVQEKKKDERKLKEYERKVLKETKQAKEKLFKIIKANNISYESLDRLIKEYKDYEDGRIKSSLGEAEALSIALENIIKNLFENGYKNLVKDFAIEHKKIPNEIGKYTFSKTLDLYYQEKKILKDKKRRELWASWGNLVLVDLTIFNGEEECEKLKRERDFLGAFNFGFILGEMRQIRDRNRLLGTKLTSEPIFFVKENYISHASRIHNYLIQGLSKKEISEVKKQEIKVTKIPPLEFKEPEQKQSLQKISLKSLSVSYNDDKATLEIGGRICAIPPYKNEHYFCRAMYEHNVNEPVDWSIIYEKMTGYYEVYYGKPQQTRENWRLVYDTMRALNKRIKNTINTDDNLFTWQEKTVKRNY